MGKTFNASVDWLGMVENPDQNVDPSVNGEKAQTGEEIIQGGTLPEVEVSALTDESYNKLSNPQKQIYDSFVTPDGVAQTVDIGNDRDMHWKNALKMTDDLGVKNIYNRPSVLGQMFPKTFDFVNSNDYYDFRPHASPIAKDIYVPKLIEPDDPLYYNWAKSMIDDLKLGEEYWVKQMSEQERKNKIHKLRTTVEDAYRREYFKDVIAEFAHIPEFWRSESFYNIPKSFMKDAIRFFKGEEMDRSRYQDKDHYEYKTHTGPDSFEEKLREKYKMKDGEEVVDPEREKWKEFAVKNESGYYYIRNKDSAVKKLDANGKWTGDYYKIYENGKYYPYYGNGEKTATIGHGHHPTHIDIFDTYKDGIDDDKALELLDIDLDEKLRLATHYYDKTYGTGEWDKLTTNEKFMLVDYEYNMGNNFGGYENYVDAIRTKDFDRALKEFKRKNNKGGGYMGRDASYLETYLQPWMNIQKEKVAVAPPLDETPLPIGVYREDMSEPKKKETSWWRGEEGWIPDELEFWNYKHGGHMDKYGKRWEEREQDSSAMPPQQTLNNTLTVEDNLALDKTIKDLNGFKYGGQYKYGLDLRNTKLEQGDEVDDDIYSTKKYSHSAKKYKRMIPKYQNEKKLPKAQFGRQSIMSGNAYGLRPEGSTGVLGDFYDKSGISDGKYKWLLGDTKTGGASGAFVSNLLDIANIPSNLMAEATEYFGERGDKEFNFLDAMPGFSGDFSFTNMYGEPTKTVSGTLDDQGNPLVDNFWGALATDIFTDPTSYVGVGLVTKGSKLPSAIKTVKKGVNNAKTNVNNAMSGTKMTNKGLQIWDGEDWVLSNKQQALNTIKKIIAQSKQLQNDAASKVKGAKEKLLNLEKNKGKLLSDFEKMGFDTKELHDEAYLDVFSKYVKMGRGEKFQQNIVDDMTTEFYELSDFLDNVDGNKFDDLLDAINKGKKIDDKLVKKHLSKSAYERFMNIKNTVNPSRQYDEGSTRIK